MKHKFLILLILVFLGYSAFGSNSGVTKQSLLIAWEKQLRSDPGTITFKKLEDGLYQYHTKHFPFNGELRLLNIVIDYFLPPDEKIPMGIMEVELVGIDNDFIRKHTHSYRKFTRMNTLYYDKDLNTWISSDQWTEKRLKKLKEKQYSFWFELLPFILVFVVVLVIAVIINYYRKRKEKDTLNYYKSVQNQSLENQRKMIALQKKIADGIEENQHLLLEIKDALIKNE
jgi:hypothetical protein